MSIRLRLAVAFGVLLLAFTSIMGLLVYRSAASALNDEVDRSLLEPATRVAHQLGSDQGVGRLPAGLIAQKVDKAGTATLIDTRAARPPRDANGAAPQPAEADDLEPLPVTGEAKNLLDGSTSGPLTQSVETDEGLWRVVSVRTPSGLIQVGRDYSYVTSALSSLARTATLSAALAAAAGFLIAWLLAGALTRRLTRLTHAVQALPADAGQGEVPAEGRDEIASLAGAFNQLLASMRQVRERERQLMEDVAHELRTPLTSLKTNAQLLPRYSQLSEDDQAALAKEMSQEADELICLVEQALTLSGGEPALTLAAVRLEDTARDASRLAVRAGVDVSIEGNSTIVGDEMMLRRALTNLVGNAMKFAPGSPIHILIEADSQWARVSVRDWGAGFAPGSSELAGQRFWRAEEHRSVMGSGLGLAIVGQIAHAHDGTLDVGNAPDGGALVSITVPTTHSAALTGNAASEKV